jgi:hypothetical protein
MRSILFVKRVISPLDLGRSVGGPTTGLYFMRRLFRSSSRPAAPSVTPSRANDAGAVAVDGSDAIPIRIVPTFAARE